MLNILQRLNAFAGDLAADRRGVTAIVTGVALTVLMGFAGLAVDIAAWLNATRAMQAAADQAAYSAASAAGTNGCASNSATQQARAVAATRGYTDGINQTTVAITCNGSNSTFTVRIQQVQPMWFTSLFLPEAPSAAAVATAQLAGKVSDLCILALDGTNVSEGTIGSDAAAAQMQGNTTLNVRCGIAVDSSNISALSAGGSAAVTATNIYLVGDMQGSPAGSASIATSPVPNNILKNQPPIEDPYLGRVVPPLSSCTRNVSGGYAPPTGNVTPGVFCGGLTFGSNGGNDNYNLTDNAVYYVVGGELRINASARVTGSGVTFVLTGNMLGQTGYATARINGGSRVSLTAPTTGPFGGLVIFQDRRAPSAANSTCGNGGAQNKLNGGTNQTVTGALYFPNQSVCFTGGASVAGAGRCTQLIARTLDFTGDSEVRFSCEGAGISPISVMVPQLVK